MEASFNQALEKSLNDKGVILIGVDDVLKIKPHVGEGGFGKVYKGVYKGIDIAIKKIKLDTSSLTENDIIKEITNEIDVVLYAEHPRFPKFYGLWKRKGHFHLIFEFIAGSNLKEKYGVLDRKEKLQVVHQLCEILEVIHAKKLIHRDIKPNNLMIEEGNIVRLIDFGISKIAKHTVTFTGCQAGTVPYMAPEVMDADIDIAPDQPNAKPITISTKVDVWSAGCLISEIFSGITPWKNKCKNELAIQRKLMTRSEFPIPNNIEDEAVIEIIKKACQPDANERIDAAELKRLVGELIISDK